MVASSSSARATTSRRRRVPLPAVDERLVMPESRYEAIDGEITYVSPSDEPHGTYHSKIAALLEAHVVASHRVAVDMLTRTSEKNDMAPDASVFPAARDPETGGRLLEELAFEVVSTESLSHSGKKARALIERGVRRVFAVNVEKKRVLEWSRKTNAWEVLATDGAIEDRVFVVPLPFAVLAEAVRADDAVARALLAKKNPVIEDALRIARNDGKVDGKIEGKIEALLQILEARGVSVKKKARERIRAQRDEAVVDRWLARAVTVNSAEALLGK